jgi:hypothetical protein
VHVKFTSCNSCDNTSNISSRCESRGGGDVYPTYETKHKEYYSRCCGKVPTGLSCCSDVSVLLLIGTHIDTRHTCRMKLIFFLSVTFSLVARITAPNNTRLDRTQQKFLSPVLSRIASPTSYLKHSTTSNTNSFYKMVGLVQIFYYISLHFHLLHI